MWWYVNMVGIFGPYDSESQAVDKNLMWNRKEDEYLKVVEASDFEDVLRKLEKGSTLLRLHTKKGE